MKFSIVLLGLFMKTLARPESGYNYEPSIQIQPSMGYLPSHTIEPSITYGTPDIYSQGHSHGYNHGNVHQDQRHFYFFAAPDDEAPARFRVYVTPSSRRNTKIIFVKAPSYGGIIPEVIAPPSQAEEKTKIYVLVKKPHHGGSVTIPSSLGVKQAKPEVFFIKYKNHHDAAAVVNRGLVGASVGTHLEDLGNEQTFVRTLESSRFGTTGAVTSIIDDSVLARGRYGVPGDSGPYKK